MKVEFYLNPQTGEPHCLDHGVTEEEVVDVLEEPLDRQRGRDGTWILSGQTREGRWLRVILREEPRRRLVITAYPPGPKTTGALRRLKRRKRR